MQLKEMMDYLGIKTNVDIEIGGIQYDSRKIKKGDFFVALSGYATDGHQYIQNAVSNGAVAVLSEKEANTTVPVFICNNTRKAIAKLAYFWYGFPDCKMRLIGVTGTNGKTTITHLIKWVLEQENNKTGLIGTINNQIGDKELPASNTTPEPLALAEIMAQMQEDGCKTVVMEVSSHALKQDRALGCHFDGAIFTNLTQDHLDFHHTFEDYLVSKIKLFTELGKGNTAGRYGVINVDDPAAGAFIEACSVPIWTYGIEKEATLQAVEYFLTPFGSKFSLLYQGQITKVQVPLTGKFNVYNALAAISALLAEGLELPVILQHLTKVPQVAGRFQKIEEGQPYMVIIDYAHTPDGLENVLRTARDLAGSAQLITVFGCGGDRDKAKRPIMGVISGRLSDYTIVTSDNPRTENPLEIIGHIQQGISSITDKYTMKPDRRCAIAAALKMAQPGDVVIIAGKGHENYQIVGKEILHFDDAEIAREILRQG